MAKATYNSLGLKLNLVGLVVQPLLKGMERNIFLEYTGQFVPFSSLWCHAFLYKTVGSCSELSSLLWAQGN